MLRAGFIGIDKHQDPQIRDLTGAARDAKAIWALFCDTIPEIEAKLLVDDNATTAAIREVFEESLGGAGPDDTVILSFAGHGTHDHRIVTHNTAIDALVDTAISMEEIANRFKLSKAKSILLILDCCFSGGAPARVLEDTPISRDPGFPLRDLGGKGRILISAANINEVAYECPASRHGLLTEALLDAFQTSENTLNLASMMDHVMARVRAAAGKMGVEQTPVMFGYIEGGMTIPRLIPGAHYFSLFPERRGIQIGSSVKELVAFALPEDVLTEWESWFPSLNELQLQAVNDYRILDGESLLVVAPTSSGKTFIGEMSGLRAIVEGRKAVFLLPYKALANEKYDQFSERYGQKLGVRVIRCTGDRIDSINAFVRGKYDLALLTYEMFLGLAVSNPTVLNHLGLVVLDEAQFIADPKRGITVELLLTYLLAARERGIAPQLIALSAVIGNLNNFDEWLACKGLITDKRPVPLIEGVLDRSGVLQYLDTTGAVKTRQLLSPGAVRQRKEKPGAQDIIVPLVRLLIEQNAKEQIIIFRNRRGPAEGCAAYLADDLRLPPAEEALAALPAHDLSNSSTRLRHCLRGGTAFHSTNLFPEEKEVVERAFRNPKGKVKVLAATTTVAAGINTPASTVILAEQEFVGEDGRNFTVAEYKNMAGRAGRLGYNEQGQSIILAHNAYQRDTLFHRYVLGALDPLRSSFDLGKIDTWILRLLAQVGRIEERDIVRLLVNTYGGYLAVRDNPDWKAAIEQRLAGLLLEMAQLGIVDKEGTYVQLSLLGQVCGRSSLTFSSSMRLIGMLRGVKDRELTVEQMMALVQGLPELDDVYVPLMKTRSKAGQRVAQSETGWPRNASYKYGPPIVEMLQRYARDIFDYYAHCKRALLLWEWTHGIAMETIEQNYSVNMYYNVGYGDVRSCADTTRFHLRAAFQIATVLFVDKGPSEESVETILRQLEVGLPADAIELLHLPLTLTRGEYLALYRMGVRTPDDLWAHSNEVLTATIGTGRTLELEKLRPKATSVVAGSMPSN